MLAHSSSTTSLVSSAKEDGAAHKSPSLGSTRSISLRGSSTRLSSRGVGETSEGGFLPPPDGRADSPAASTPRSLRPPITFTMDKDGHFHAAPSRPPLVLSGSSSSGAPLFPELGGASSSKRSVDSQSSTPSVSRRNLNLYAGVDADPGASRGVHAPSSSRRLQGTPRSGAAAAAARTRTRAQARWRAAVTFLRAAWRFAAPVRRARVAADERRVHILAARAGPPRTTADDVSLPWGAGARSAVACLRAPTTHAPSAITSWLFVGDRADAADADRLLALGITHVLNVATNCPAPPHAHQFVYEHLPIFDSDAQKIADVLPRALALIRDAHTSGGRVLVHCIMGVSRSVTLAAAYLVSASGPRLPLATALALLVRQRPVAMPNAGFRLQLALYEFAEQGTSSVADLDRADAAWDFSAWRVNTIRTGLLADRAQTRTLRARVAAAARAAARLWGALLQRRKAAVAPG
jgi:hypothetical protein